MDTKQDYLKKLREVEEERKRFFEEYDLSNLPLLERIKKFTKLKKTNKNFYLKDKKNREKNRRIKKKYNENFPRSEFEKPKNSTIITFAIKNPKLWEGYSVTKFIEKLLREEKIPIITKNKKKTIGRRSANIDISLLPKWKILKDYCKSEGYQIAEYLEKKFQEYKIKY